MTLLSVATLNLRSRHDRWLQRRHLIVAEILERAPDLLSLQEISLPIGQGRWLRNQVNSRLGENRYRLVQKRKAHLYHGYFEGVGVLTKLPVISRDSISLGYNGRVALRVNVELENGQTVDFVATHLHHVAPDRQARLEQAMAIVGWLNQAPRIAYQIIAGDLNEIPAGPAVQYLKQTFRSAFAEKWGDDPPATFPTMLVNRGDGWSGCLDYILLSSRIGSVLDARTFCRDHAPDDDTLYASDHVGLITTLEIPDT